MSLKNDRQLYGRILNAELVFLDAASTKLAQGEAREPLGIVSIYHPKAGDCTREERKAPFNLEARKAWQQCFETKSRWLMTWIRDVRYVRVSMGNCLIDKVPVAIEEFKDDWWFWWVPLRHVGGSPYTYFKLTLWVDSVACRASNR